MAIAVEQKMIQTRVLDILETIAGTEQIRQDPDLELFEQHILDSLGMVELIIALSEEFTLDIAPAEIEREQWSSPRKIIAQISSRLGKANGETLQGI